VYFYNAAIDVGADNIAKVARAFYLDQKTGINIPGEVVGTLPSPEWKVENIGENWYPGDTILYGIGQGFLNVTPLQMITLYNTIANRGTFVKPKLLINEEVVSKKILLDIPDPYWDLVIQGLEEVTTVQGSGANAGTAAASFKGFPIAVAGKTGTAQVGSGQPHALVRWFRTVKAAYVLSTCACRTWRKWWTFCCTCCKEDLRLHVSKWIFRRYPK